MLGPHADLLRPMESPEPAPSPLDQCTGMGCAGERARQRVSPCPPSVSLPATRRCHSEQLQERMSAWQFASASPPGDPHHITRVPQKHRGWDREGSFFVTGRTH